MRISLGAGTAEVSCMGPEEIVDPEVCLAPTVLINLDLLEIGHARG
jgi:hypothetical protein